MSKIVGQKSGHPLDAEELMAYLDGELSQSRAAVAAAHLGQCAECKAVVDGVRAVSQKIGMWEVNVPETSVAQVNVAGVNMPLAIADALEKRLGMAVVGAKLPWWRSFLAEPRLRWAMAGGAVASVAVLAIIFSLVGRMQRDETRLVASREGAAMPQKARQGMAAYLENAPPAPLPSSPTASASPEAPREELAQARARDAISSSLENPPSDRAYEAHGVLGGRVDGTETAQSNLAGLSGPMIIRTADLKLTTKELDKARAAIESILKQRHGYVGDLTVGGATGGPRTLTATLRVPADQLDAVVSELKALGHVDSESQGGQDVTSQYVDLQARLENARNTEKRLTDLLNQRTGRLSDVLQVEQEVDRVRGEIEQMEAQRKTMANQVTFATLTLTVAEEYKAQLEAVPPSTRTRLRNAAVDGYRSMVDGIVGVILFSLSSGPSLLLWCGVLFFPARGAWRMARRRWAQE